MKKAVQKLKCGGKVKKYQDGGETTEDKTKLLDALKESLGKIDLSTEAGKKTFGGISDMITGTFSGALSNKKDSLLSGMDNRIDPTATLKKANGLDTGSALLSGIGKGATFGPAGMAVGAALAGVKRLLGTKQRLEDQVAQKEDWSNSWSSKTAANLRKSGYKKGGEIKGKGTGKSDSIDMKLEEGAFIVPVENADYAEELGKTYLGWDEGEKAKRNYKDGGKTIDAKVSDGEIYFTKDEKNILQYHGVNLDELAPKAENKTEMKDGGPTKEKAMEILHDGTVHGHPLTKKQRGYMAIKAGYKKGGEATSPYTYDKENDLVIDDKTKTAYDKAGAEYVFNIDENKYVKLKSGSPYGLDIYSQATKGDTDTPEWMKNLPEFAGAIQAAGGAFGLMQAGKTPDISVSRTLNKLSGEVRKLSEYGYEPNVINSLNMEIENTRRNLSKQIENEGGSGLEKMAKLNSLLSTTIDKKAGLAFANAAEKARKWADVIKVDTMKAGQEFDINKIKLEDYYKNQEMFAGLVSAGISNIVGSRQLKSEQENLRKIGNTSVNFKS